MAQSVRPHLKAKEPMTVKVSPEKLMLTDRDMKAHQFRRHK
jgi:hypothetical protein